MKNKKVALFSLLALAISITVGCGGGGLTFNKMTLVSDRDGATNLYVAKMDGSDLAPVSNGPEAAWSPSISANGKKIVYLVGGNVWGINADGSSNTQLTTNTGDNTAYEPRISPDGKQIVFGLWDENSETYNIWLMNADGTGKQNLTATLPSGMEGCYSGNISSDDKKVTFACYDGEDVYTIFTANSDGTNPQPVVSTTGNGSWYDLPMFSPDGKKILFEGIDLSVSGGVRTNAKSNAVGPRTRENGKLNPHGGGASSLGIYSVNLDGSGITPVVPNAYDAVILNSNLYYTLPDESVDFQIWKSAVDGTGAAKVSDGTVADRLALSFYDWE